MKQCDIEQIKRRTNYKIGYHNFKEEMMRKDKMHRKIGIGFGMIFILTVGTFTANAATNNGIVHFIHKMIKVNDKEASAEVYEVPEQNVYSTLMGDYITTDSFKCVKYSPVKDYSENESTICYPLDTEFDTIELFYDETNHFAGFHITGTRNGEPFDDLLKDSNE